MKEGLRFGFGLIMVLVLLLFVGSFALAQEAGDEANAEPDVVQEDASPVDEGDFPDDEDRVADENSEDVSDDSVGEEGPEGGLATEGEFEFEDDFDVGDHTLAEEGITPDSALYFLDEFFDRFSDDLDVKEEKIAEIRAMVREGKFDKARESLEKYREYADNLEKEVDPDREDDVRRSAVVIRSAIEEIKDDIPNEDGYGDEILNREDKIVTSVEIAGKIKGLCQALSQIDPLEYSRICKVDENSPGWQKKLDKDLTNSQREEAREFGVIMSECFRTSGETCRCEEISFTDFAEQCSVMAPLAYACDALGDESSCERMDKLERENDPFELLPDYLQDVVDDIEGEYLDARLDKYLPKECKEAGVTDKGECMKIMVRKHAPPECVEEIESRDITNEREAREICEKIMFETHAPEECVNAGLTDHRECGKFMFSRNAPEECVNAGLTGEQESDRKVCEKIMRELGENREDFETHGGGYNCKGIEDSQARLKCYDGASTRADNRHQEREDFDERYRETKTRERECSESCSSQGGSWDFSNGDCTCRFDDYDSQEQYEYDESGNYREDFKEEYREDYNDYGEYNNEDGNYENKPEEYNEETYDDYEEYSGGDYSDEQYSGETDSENFDSESGGYSDDAGSEYDSSDVESDNSFDSGGSSGGDSGSSGGSSGGDSSSGGGDSGSSGGSSGGDSSSGGGDSGSSGGGDSSSGGGDSGSSGGGDSSSGGGDSGGPTGFSVSLGNRYLNYYYN
jgi:hypothetical protein